MIGSIISLITHNVLLSFTYNLIPRETKAAMLNSGVEL